MLNPGSDQLVLAMLRDPLRREEGFRQMMGLYQEKLYSLIFRMTRSADDTHDVLQETLVKVLLNADRFQGNSSLYTWVYRIAVNESISFLKKRKRRMTSDLEPDTHGQIEQGLAAGISEKEVQKVLKEAIELLPEKQRIVFNLRYFEELGYQQMSEILETSVGSLKASYHHAVKKIENHLQSVQIL